VREVIDLPVGVLQEGAGDCIWDRNRGFFWAGHGQRSTANSLPVIADTFGQPVVGLELATDRFYHLDTCFCPLDGGFVMYYPPAFDDGSRAAIERRVPAERRIAISEEDALAFACNAVNIDSVVVVNKATSPFVKALSRHGFEVVQTPLSEFMKAGGSAKCLTLRLDEP
jgi:N-dimethylarginine dimethylaminohydrolase